MTEFQALPTNSVIEIDVVVKNPEYVEPRKIAII
jgi:hypothetical protein